MATSAPLSAFSWLPRATQLSASAATPGLFRRPHSLCKRTYPLLCHPTLCPQTLNAVIYAASPARSTDETYEAAYVDGPCNLLIGAFFRGLTVQICQRAGVTRIATE